MCQDSVTALREVGELLAWLRQPEPPQGLRDAWDKMPVFRKVLNMAPRVLRRAPVQANVLEGEEVDLHRLPIQTCWPGEDRKSTRLNSSHVAITYDVFRSRKKHRSR